MSNPTWQDITPQRAREVDTPCVGEPCTNPEHDHEAAPTNEWDWAELGRLLRQSADDAHEGATPSVEIAYSFLLSNAELFGFAEWPADMPQEPNCELIAGYQGAGPTCNECGSDNDFGTSAETGYHDAGELLYCRNCGHMEQL